MAIGCAVGKKIGATNSRFVISYKNGIRFQVCNFLQIWNRANSELNSGFVRKKLSFIYKKFKVANRNTLIEK